MNFQMKGTGFSLKEAADELLKSINATGEKFTILRVLQEPTFLLEYEKEGARLKKILIDVKVDAVWLPNRPSLFTMSVSVPLSLSII